jgi:hypothetical protein
VVTTAAPENTPEGRGPDQVPAPPLRASPDDDATMTRINLRLSQELKERVEQAAQAAGLSVNAWLVRSAAAALDAPVDGRAVTTGSTARSARGGGDHYTGWVH